MTDKDRHFEEAFCLERGFGITQYAYYEESLACLFAYLMGVTPDLAGIPFFKINNSRSRLAIIERLLRKKHGNQYKLFWNSVTKQLNELDIERNKIVHWTSVTTWSNEPFTSLVPPNYWDEDENTPSLVIADLVAFTEKCKFFTMALSSFLYALQGKPFVPSTWHEIFQRPLTYPIPADHPLHKTK